MGGYAHLVGLQKIKYCAHVKELNTVRIYIYAMLGYFINDFQHVLGHINCGFVQNMNRASAVEVISESNVHQKL